MFNEKEKIITTQIESMFNFKTFNIYRLVTPDDESPGSYKIGYTDTGRTITGRLKVANAEYAMMVEGSFGKTYILISDQFNCDIDIGDRLKEGDLEYEVKGVNKHEDAPSRKITVTLIKVIDQS